MAQGVKACSPIEKSIGNKVRKKSGNPPFKGQSEWKASFKRLVTRRA